MTRKAITLTVLLALAVARLGAALTYDHAVISPYIEKPSSPLDYIFTSYASGAAEGSNYYLFTTNITGYVTSPRNYPGECVYYWPEIAQDKEIAEDVVMYRGTNTSAAFNAGTPFTALRTATPCFDGRFGEVSEQANRTWAYGGGDTDISTIKNKAYIVVNRVRGRYLPASHSITGGDWSMGDFREVFIGAKETLAAAASVAVGASGRCRGEAVPPTNPDYCLYDAFAWNPSPLVQISTIGTDTYSTTTPVLAEVNAATPSLPMFTNLPAGTILFGFMRFGRLQDGPSRIAAVAITDSSTTTRPSNAVLYYRVGSSFVPATGGTMSTLPDDQSAALGYPLDVHDVEWDPNVGNWFLYTRRANSLTTSGCNDGVAANGVEFVKINLATLAGTGFWPSQNALGRFTIDAHFIGSDEFILYSSTDRRCISGSPAGYTTDTGINQWRSMEILVRNRSLGPPN